MKAIYLALLLSVVIAGCSSESQPTHLVTPITPLPVKQGASSTSTAPTPTATPLATGPKPPTLTAATAQLTVEIPTTTPTRKPAPTLAPEAWKQMPVVPIVGDTVVQIYQKGTEMGNNPHAFSKIGDCGSTPAWFLGDFDRGPEFYRLDGHQDLAAVIQEFQGSFSRTSQAARSGFNSPALFEPLWADRAYCEANETPIACEYRIQRPAFAFIMLGTNDIWHPDQFEPQMRKIIEFSIEKGVVPILSTKADNAEGNYEINATIARLAAEYDIPLWNFWLAVQSLPDKGLQEDQAHLTWGRNFFDDPESMTKAWPIRNLTALQVLDAVWRKATGQGD